MKALEDIHLHLYLVRMKSRDDGEEFYKIGITKHWNIGQRFSYGEAKVADSDLPVDEIIKLLFDGQKYVSDHPYDVEVVHTVYYSIGGYARIAERDLLAAIGAKRYRPRRHFSGASECFRGIDLNKIVDFMDEHSKEANESAPSEFLYRVHFNFCKEADEIQRHLKTLESIGEHEQLDKK